MLQINDGSYELTIPESWLPLKTDWTQWEQHIDYSMTVKIRSSQTISDLCIPTGFQIKKKISNKIILEKIGNDLNSIDNNQPIRFMYRTKNMDKPRLVYQRCPEMAGYVAFMVQFIPTFERRQAI